MMNDETMEAKPVTRYVIDVFENGSARVSYDYCVPGSDPVVAFTSSFEHRTHRPVHPEYGPQGDIVNLIPGPSFHTLTWSV